MFGKTLLSFHSYSVTTPFGTPGCSSESGVSFLYWSSGEGALSAASAATAVRSATLLPVASNTCNSASPTGQQDAYGNNIPTTLTAGTLRLGNGGRLGSGNVTIQGGILDLGSTVYAGAPIYLNAGTVRAQQSLNVAKFAVAASGRIEANLVGTTGLNKTTVGTLILAGANTYTGVTSVSAGKLQVDGAVGKVIVNF